MNILVLLIFKQKRGFRLLLSLSASFLKKGETL